MSKQELLDILKAMDVRPEDEYVDLEERHQKAEHALLDYIGDPDIREAYDRLEKWYS